VRTVAGLWFLLVILLRSRFRLGGPYWVWRRRTAVGHERRPTRETVAGVLEYARWVARMRRIAR